jgi:DNA-binding NtrC family response regulator
MSALKALRVLVVDDNEDMCAFMKIVLDEAGCETQLAADGERALDSQREHPVDVLITDIFMPETDGIELIEHFRSRYPRIKVVAMSGGGQIARKDYLSVATELGALAVLQKPFDAATLLKTLRDLAER